MGTIRTVVGIALFLFIGWLSLPWVLGNTYWTSYKTHSAVSADYKRQASLVRQEYDQNKIGLRDRIHKERTLEIEKGANLDMMTKGIRNCPDNYTSNDLFMGMDLDTCPVGQPIWLPLPDKFRERRYEVTLSVKTPNGEITPVLAEPVIKVVKEGDGFSIAQKVGKNGPSTVFSLRGEVSFVNKGNASHAELRLLP